MVCTRFYKTFTRQPDVCIQHALFRHAKESPDAVAIVAPGRSPLDYAGLWTRVSEIATVFRGFGLEPGDRIALVMPDGPDMAVAFLAVSAVAAAAPLNPACRQSEFETYFDDLHVKMLLTTAGDDSPAVTAARIKNVRLVRLTIDRDAAAGVFSLDVSPAVPLHDVPYPSDGSGTRASDVALVLTTSGTTSRPKVVALTHANIHASALNISASLGLSPHDRCLDVMPLFHVHGLIGGLLSSLAAGASVVCPPGFDAPRFFGWMDECEPTWFTGVPTMYQAILARAAAHRDVIARRPLRFIRSASSALPEQLRTALEKEFNAATIEAYGMTEASHQIAVNPLPPGVRKPLSVGVAAGTEVAIVDGEIVIRGASVIGEYEGNPTATASAFTDGWLRTGDTGYLDKDGYLFIKGRLKEQINRGGEKISPREVDEALLDHPAVGQAVTFAAPHDTLGQDVAAAVVLRPEAECTERELREFAAARLAPFKVPARVFFLDEIPKGPTGKVQRNRLAEQLNIQNLAPAPSAARAAFVAPRTPLEQKLAVMWADLLGVPEVGIHDNFLDLGGDSILGARLLARVTGELHAELSVVSLFDRPTLEEMARTVADHQRPVPTAAPGRNERRPSIVKVDRQSFRVQRAAPAERAPSLDAPLSFGQQRLWFVDQWRPGTGVFNSRVPIWLSGPLHVAALEQSLATVVRRHGSLRTSFPAADGQPVQRVASALSVPLPVIDLRELPEDTRTAEVYKLITQELWRPFDLSRGPLVRASLLRVSATEHVLLLTIHHIIYDGWSRAVLLRELSTLYAGFVRGAPVSLPPLSFQYTDYAEREVKQTDVIARHLAFWEKQLGGDLPVLELPCDYPRPEVADIRGAQHTCVLRKDLATAVEALARREGATPFMMLLTVFKMLLSRYTGIEDMLVGSPIAGRNSVEAEALIGFFIKTLILRTDLSGNPSFRELLGRVRGVTLDALDHQDLPFQQLVTKLQVERFANRNPICDVTLNFLNTPDLELDFHGATGRYFEPLDRQAEYSLMMFVFKRDGEFTIRMGYQRALFSPERIAHIVEQFQTLLEQVVDAPDLPIRAYSLVAPSSRRLLPDPSVALSEPRLDPVTTTVFAHARSAPAAIAVSQAGRTWTYGELAERADALAGALIASGHQPGDVVAVTGRASFGVIASIVAVLSSGGVLLTIDPDLPPERKRVMVREGRARRIVHIADRPDAHEHVRGFASCPIVDVDENTAIPFDATLDAKRDTAYEPAPGDSAYIFFTSGTSGVPKGVLGCHKGLAHFVAWQREQFAVTPDARCAQLTSLSFDVVLRDVFLPLVSGATLCLPGSRRPVGDDVLEWLERERITHVHAVPALVGSWLAHARSGVALRSLQYTFFAGEPLTGALVQKWRAACSESARIVNLYGATEATLAQCFYVVPPDPSPGVQPVGSPVPDTQALVLTKDRQLCGIGERGEIAMRSRFLTRGYVNAADETRSKFVRNPFRDDDGDLLYLTGDEGRYRPDGALEILGRLDDQVKIRGVRVELEEVNVQISQHPAVKSSCVVARKNEQGETAIVAYVVPSDPDAVNARQLRTFLSKRLSSAMVPSAFVLLPELPLTPNGKVDRAALPAGTAVRPQAIVEAVPPLNDDDRRQLAAWNDTSVVHAGMRCLHQLVEAQVERTPDAIAVMSGGEAITYDALNARANQLARLLRRRGAGPDVLVGMCVERSIEMVVALLGVLKAGGAYVPLDPSYPQERLNFMLQESGARLLVSEARLAGRFQTGASDVVCMDADRGMLASECVDNPDNDATLDNLAYVMFTSGSTGKPKGVMIPHRAICNHMLWMQGTFPLAADDRVLQRTPCSFDASVWEFYAPLMAGARLVMAPPAGRFNPAELVDTIAANGVTILQLVPSLLRILLDEPNLERCGSLRRVFCGGESLPFQLQERFFARLGADLHNLYGPTEACIDATFWTCARGGPERAVPIGRPIANTQAYVLGPDMQPVPIGTAGELYLGGAGLARGYVNRPELTAERFIPHPVSGVTGACVYATGDRVRHLPDGNLEFLGRADDQVKVRGVRIELQEVDATLRRHPNVRESAVVARDDGAGGRRLIAYYVARDPAAQPDDSLRRFLLDTLPESMVPSTFVRLDAMPLTQSGKVDRQMLPAPAGGRPELSEVFVAPRTDAEQAIARIWGEVLRVDPIGVHDDFFDLGGHSLLATQIISRVNDLFGQQVSLGCLFDTPTIAGLAAEVERPGAGKVTR